MVGVTAPKGAPELAAQAASLGRSATTVVYDSVAEMAKHVDVIAVFAPNFARLAIGGADRGGGEERRRS